MSKKGVSQNRENWNWIRYMIGDKMFAAVCLDQQDVPYCITLKLTPGYFAILKSILQIIIVSENILYNHIGIILCYNHITKVYDFIIIFG